MFVPVDVTCTTPSIVQPAASVTHCAGIPTSRCRPDSAELGSVALDGLPLRRTRVLVERS